MTSTATKKERSHQEGGGGGLGAQAPSGAVPVGSDKDRIYQLVLELTNTETRESALLELSKKREAVPELAPILWHSFGTIACLLQEIIAIYPLLSPPKLKAHASNRVCNALALLQCVASHPDTRTLFLNGSLSPLLQLLLGRLANRSISLPPSLSPSVQLVFLSFSIPSSTQ